MSGRTVTCATPPDQPASLDAALDALAEARASLRRVSRLVVELAATERAMADAGEVHPAELLRRAARAIRPQRPHHADEIEASILPAWEEAEEDGEEAPPC